MVTTTTTPASTPKKKKFSSNVSDPVSDLLTRSATPTRRTRMSW